MGCTDPYGSVSCTAVDRQSVFAACHQYIPECKPPFLLSLNGEWNVGGWLVEVCIEELQVLLSMGPDDKGIVHIPQPEAGLKWG